MPVVNLYTDLGIGYDADNHPSLPGQIRPGDITSEKLADNSVTTAKIADGTVVTADIADSSVTETKIAFGAVTRDSLSGDISISIPGSPFNQAVAEILAQDTTPANAAAAAVTTAIANRNILDGPTLIAPVLLLAPDGSANASGAVTPTKTGSPTVVAGTYGNAWQVNAGGDSYSVANSGYIGRNEGTAIVRAKFTTTLTNGQVQSALYGSTEGFRITVYRINTTANGNYIRFQAGSPLVSFTSAPNTAPDNSLMTIALSWKAGSARCFLNGVFVGSFSFTVGTVDQTTIYTSASGSIPTFQSESYLFYTQQLSDAEIARISALTSAHAITTKSNLGIVTIGAATTKFTNPAGSGATSLELRASDSSAVTITANPTGTLSSNGVELGGPVGTDRLAASAVTPEKTSFLSLGKNLFNPATVTPNTYLIESTGVAATLAGYVTSDFIPVVSGQPYTVTQARKFVLYDANKVYVSGQNITQLNPVTVTPAVNGFARFANNTALGTYTANIQFEKGSSVTTYEPYLLNAPLLSLTTAQVTSLVVAVDAAKSPPLTLTKSGELFTVQRQLAGAGTLVVETQRNGSSNGAFNFLRTRLNGTVIHDTADDVTPIRTFTTVGANHGYTSITRLTVAGHAKVTADLGSIYTDGTNQYTLLAISGNDLIFGNGYTEPSGVVAGSATAPVATLTHVSGGTNTGSVSIATPVASPQLYPSINNVSVKYQIDGVDVTADGTYSGSALRVVESYQVMDYKAIIDWAQAHIGQSYANNSVAGVVRISNVFTIRGNSGNCTVSSALTALRKVSFLNCGFLQSVALGATGYTTYRYMPGVIAKSGIDFAAPVDMTAYATSLLFGPSDYVDTAHPPSRYVDWLQDGSGNKLVGFTMGYITDKTNSQDTDRAVLSVGWDMRNTKKSYPVALTGVTLNAGDYRNIEGFRNYIAPHESRATIVNTVTDAASTYVHLDFHTTKMTTPISLPEHIGKTVTTVNASGLTVVNNVVDASGVVVNVAGSAGYAVLKV